MQKQAPERAGERLDRLLFTRPMFETLFGENNYSPAERRVVITETAKVVFRHRWAQICFVAVDVLEQCIFRIMAQGRMPTTGMLLFIDMGDLVWYQVTDWDVAQRARRVLGRVARRNDCSALFCGWRHHTVKGEPLPVFVLLSPSWQVLEVAYGDGDAEGYESLVPGVGPNLRPIRDDLRPALRILASRLEISDFDDRLRWAVEPSETNPPRHNCAFGE